VGCFFIGKQKIVLFPKYRENGWESAASALRPLYSKSKKIDLKINYLDKNTNLTRIVIEHLFTITLTLKHGASSYLGGP
jgi:hypothetical protein